LATKKFCCVFHHFAHESYAQFFMVSILLQSDGYIVRLGTSEYEFKARSLKSNAEGQLMNIQVSQDIRKGIYVDGPAANMMKKSHQIAELHLPGLYHVLVNKVGHARKLGSTPLFTADPGRVDQQWMSKCCAGAGFQPLFHSSNDGSDDNALIQRLESVDTNVIQEIVIVTGDKDYIPVLRTKVSQGATVYWVATARRSPSDNNTCLSRELLDLFSAKVFTFVELGQYASFLVDQRRDSTLQPGRRDDSEQVTQFTLTLKSRNKQDHLKLGNEMQRLRMEFAGKLQSTCTA
jgi:hypothetical protein